MGTQHGVDNGDSGAIAAQPAPGSQEAAATTRMHDLIYADQNHAGNTHLISPEKAASTVTNDILSNFDRTERTQGREAALAGLGRDLVGVDYQSQHGWNQTMGLARQKLEKQLVDKGVLPEGAHIISGGHGAVKIQTKDGHQLTSRPDGAQTDVAPAEKTTGLVVGPQGSKPFTENSRTTTETGPNGTVTRHEDTYTGRTDDKGRPILKDVMFEKNGKDEGGTWPPAGQELRGADGKPIPSFDNVKGARVTQTRNGTETTVYTPNGEITYQTDAQGRSTFKNPNLNSNPGAFGDVTKGSMTDNQIHPDTPSVPGRDGDNNTLTTVGRLNDGNALASGTKAEVKTETTPDGRFVSRDTTYTNDSSSPFSGSASGKKIDVQMPDGATKTLDVNNIKERAENGGITRDIQYRDADGKMQTLEQKLSPDGSRVLSASQTFAAKGVDVALPNGQKQHIDATGQTTQFGPNGERTTTYDLKDGNGRKLEVSQSAPDANNESRVTRTRELMPNGGQDTEIPGIPGKTKVTAAGTEYNSEGKVSGKTYTTADGRTISQQVDPDDPNKVLSSNEHFARPKQVNIIGEDGRPRPASVTDIQSHFNAEGKVDTKTFTTTDGTQVVQRVDGDKVTGLDVRKQEQQLEQQQRQAIERTIDQERAQRNGQYSFVPEQAWQQFRTFLVDKALHPERYPADKPSVAGRPATTEVQPSWAPSSYQ